ncbi:MAG: hypothetical protein HY359_17740 [Candidatus Rokubacteria bacterium]|nr:hypothetical protein [Candidatus Rokubacteria bacterium]
MTARALGLLLIVPLAVCPAAAGEWSAARIGKLPDSAFAVVETTPEGRRVRHLPHHDETGRVDAAHLRAARARLHQVKWLDPSSEEAARRHLDAHERAEAGR